MEIIISTLAAFLTTSAFLPQVIKVVISKKTDDISYFMYLFFTIGIIFWTIYGFMIEAYPIVVANVITFFLSLSVLVIKTVNMYKNNK